MEKKVTVAIPVFNGDKYIYDALQSIVEQSYKVDQIFISDNHSTDETVAIVKQFKNEHKDLNIELNINEYNLGYQKNFNICMKLTRTNYLLLLGVDDRLKKNTIERQIKFFEEYPEMALVGGNEEYIDEYGKIIKKAHKTKNKIYKKGEIFEFVKDTGSVIPLSAVLLNMKLIKQVGLFDEELIAPDEVYYSKVLQYFPIAILGEGIVDRRKHTGQVTNKEWVFQQQEIMKYFKAKMEISNYEKGSSRIKKTRKELKKFNSYVSMVMGEKSWRDAGKFKIAIKYWCYTLKLYPQRLFTKRYLKNWAKLILLYR